MAWRSGSIAARCVTRMAYVAKRTCWRSNALASVAIAHDVANKHCCRQQHQEQQALGFTPAATLRVNRLLAPNNNKCRGVINRLIVISPAIARALNAPAAS